MTTAAPTAPLEPHPPSRLRDLAGATPASRDRYVDLLRAVAIGCVVLGHWLIAVVRLDGAGHVHATNALAEAPALQWLTWAFQVMPLFFVVGGFANRAALRRSDGTRASTTAYLRSRVLRLGAPVLPLALTWIVAGAGLRMAGVDDGTVHLVTKVMAQPLWFLAVYLVVSAVAPWTLRLHERSLRWAVAFPAALVVAVVVNDALRLPFVHQANYLAVFVLAHQAGYALGDGTLVRWGRRTHAALAVGGLAALVLLTGPGPYPRSMVGVPGEAASNMSPPSLAVVALAALQLGVALLLRPAATRALGRRRLWTAVIAVNASIMTIFLWHLTALAVAATALVAVLHLPTGAPVASAAWWVWRGPWVLAAAVALVGLVAVAGRFERAALRPSPTIGAPNPGRLAVALTGTAAALTAFALEGFGGVGAVAAAAGLYFTRRMLIGYR
jgi:fucose 4-O-acetylase-like acetyltransferase